MNFEIKRDWLELAIFTVSKTVKVKSEPYGVNKIRNAFARGHLLRSVSSDPQLESFTSFYPRWSGTRYVMSIVQALRYFVRIHLSPLAAKMDRTSLGRATGLSLLTRRSGSKGYWASWVGVMRVLQNRLNGSLCPDHLDANANWTQTLISEGIPI